MQLFLFAASLRQDSVNKKLINLTAKLCKQQNHSVDLADFAEFDMPLYNGDIEQSTGLPQGALKFIERMEKATGLIIASPEYNFSIPGTLKNLIDWVSRANPMPWRGKRILLLSASPSMVGGNRGLWSTRIPLEQCGAFVYPDMFSLAAAYSAFQENGDLTDNNLQERLSSLIADFSRMAKALA
jgi:NAD(P)H-dependent FMN reductase